MTHHLKCWPKYYYSVKEGMKRFEIRKNDRGYKIGDIIVLLCWVPEDQHFIIHKHDPMFKITYILDEHEGLKPGFVIMQLETFDPLI